MKPNNSSGWTSLFAIAIACVGLGRFAVRAQGTIYVSNLEEPGFGYSVGDGYQSFHTGAAADGYALNALTLLMGDWLGNASGFAVSLHNDAGGQPGSALGALSGNNNPTNAGLYSYAASGLTLAPNATYWVVVSATSTQPLGGYAWQFTSSQNYASDEGWSIGTSSVGNGFLHQFAVEATAVPEPGVFALWIVGAVFFGAAFRPGKSRHRPKSELELDTPTNAITRPTEFGVAHGTTCRPTTLYSRREFACLLT